MTPATLVSLRNESRRRCPLRNGIIACILLLLTGCADFQFAAQPSILNARRDGPGLPKYLDKHESVVMVNGTHSELLNAHRDALLMLGCSDIRELNNTFRGDRTFVPGFACGVGGETLHVRTDQLTENRYSIRVVSYKRFPYPAATRFLDGDFCDILVQLLNDPNLANAP
jgi:hypothetical protein